MADLEKVFDLIEGAYDAAYLAAISKCVDKISFEIEFKYELAYFMRHVREGLYKVASEEFDKEQIFSSNLDFIHDHRAEV